MPNKGVRRVFTNSSTTHKSELNNPLNTEYEHSEISKQFESALQINANKQPRLDTPADVLRLQRLIGNQAVMRYLGQQPSLHTKVVQRHPSHAPEEELERSIQRHPSHAPEEELERSIQRYPLQDYQEKVERIVAAQPDKRCIIKVDKQSTRAASRHIQRTPNTNLSQIVMRKTPTTDQLNQKLARPIEVQFQLLTTGLEALANQYVQLILPKANRFESQIDLATTEKPKQEKDLSTLHTDDKLTATEKVQYLEMIQKSIKKYEVVLAEYPGKLGQIKPLVKPLQDIVTKVASLKTQAASQKVVDDLALQKDALEQLIDTVDLNLLFESDKKATPDEQKKEDKVKQAARQDFTSTANVLRASIKGYKDLVGGGLESDMRHKIDKVYSALPKAHTAGNASLSQIRSGEGVEGLGEASYYDSGSLNISMVTPKVPGIGISIGQGNFTGLGRGNSFNRFVMNVGAAADYKGVSGMVGDIASGKRDVMSGKKTTDSPNMGKLAKKGSLVSWIVRHETGHSVDKQIQFTKKRSKLEMFGGWIQYEDKAELKELATVMANKGGINPDTEIEKGVKLTDFLANVVEKDHGECLRDFESMTDAIKHAKKQKAYTPPQEGKGADAQDVPERQKFSKWANSASTSDRDAALRMINFAKQALGQPWMLADGAKDKLSVKGRVYQRDTYGTWVSYLANARSNAVSSYQFSTPSEWFAEAYATFYNPVQSVRNTMRADVLQWFTENLGDLNQTNDANLSTGGVLGTLDDIDEKKVDTSNVSNADKADLPGDLKSFGTDPSKVKSKA